VLASDKQLCTQSTHCQGQKEEGGRGGGGICKHVANCAVCVVLISIPSQYCAKTRCRAQKRRKGRGFENDLLLQSRKCRQDARCLTQADHSNQLIVANNKPHVQSLLSSVNPRRAETSIEPRLESSPERSHPSCWFCPIATAEIEKAVGSCSWKAEFQESAVE